MNLKDLEYFQTLCYTKSFTKTAEVLYVSQPSVTFAIHRLEDELGVKLFEINKSHRSVELTIAGQFLQDKAQSILTAVDNTVREIREFNHPMIRLGLPPIIGGYYAADIMKQIDNKGLLPFITLVEDGSELLMKKIEENKLDLAIIGSASPLSNRKINSIPITSSELVICTSKKHQFSTYDKINFQELENEKMLVLGKAFVHRTAFQYFTKKYRMAPKIVYQTDKIQTLKSLIAVNCGISLLSRMVVSDAEDITTIPLDEEVIPYFYVSICFNKNHTLSEEEKLIIELFKTHRKKSLTDQPDFTDIAR
ncbi:LysR family transcriptional regulator [Bacillus swezeyi]|uniref:LysR family transcriptional regulator n=1 Tax=Bacillus swezeyi TaxID=1925020 RepID=UPI0027DB6C45|nr:LysR family transcriptional regulator [Bacillus swezeyi]